VPGISILFGECYSSQDWATAIGVAPSRLATDSSTSDCSGEKLLSGKHGTYAMCCSGRATRGLLGIHLNLPLARLLGGSPPVESEQERAALDALAHSGRVRGRYLIDQATRPQTIGYALLDSPVALAAWMLRPRH
jgi:hypothetical protein